MSDDRIRVDLQPADMWTLLDRETVRMMLPALPIAGMPEPLRIHLDFDAATVDEILQRLTVLRAEMLPEPRRN